MLQTKLIRTLSPHTTNKKNPDTANKIKPHTASKKVRTLQTKKSARCKQNKSAHYKTKKKSVQTKQKVLRTQATTGEPLNMNLTRYLNSDLDWRNSVTWINERLNEGFKAMSQHNQNKKKN